MQAKHDTIVFDLGAVLIDWNPRYLYQPLFDGDEVAMEHFLSEVVPTAWNREIDAGKPFSTAVAERSREHPQHAWLIALWKDGWEKMLRDAIHDSVAILSELRKREHRLYALTNWSAETFPIARRRFDFLGWFEDIVVSGEVGVAKPDPRIYKLAIERWRLDPPRTVFIDDSPANVAAGQQAGLHSLCFESPEQLRAALASLRLL